MSSNGTKQAGAGEFASDDGRQEEGAFGLGQAATAAAGGGGGCRGGSGRGSGGDMRGKRGEMIGAPPSFLDKLWEILSDEQLSGYISWNKEGDGIVIRQVERFAAEVLPRHYKHNNYHSFVRQLNIYGFHKTKHDEDCCEFKQPYVRRGQRHLLALIRRKGQGNTAAAVRHREGNVVVEETRGMMARVSAELRNMCNRVVHLEAEMGMINHRHDVLKEESKALWRIVLAEGGRGMMQKVAEALQDVSPLSSELSGILSPRPQPQEHDHNHNSRHNHHHEQQQEQLQSQRPQPSPPRSPPTPTPSPVNLPPGVPGGDEESVDGPSAWKRRGGGTSGAAFASAVAAALAGTDNDNGNGDAPPPPSRPPLAQPPTPPTPAAILSPGTVTAPPLNVGLGTLNIGAGKQAAVAAAAAGATGAERAATVGLPWTEGPSGDARAGVSSSFLTGVLDRLGQDGARSGAVAQGAGSGPSADASRSDTPGGPESSHGGSREVETGAGTVSTLPGGGAASGAEASAKGTAPISDPPASYCSGVARQQQQDGGASGGNVSGWLRRTGPLSEKGCPPEPGGSAPLTAEIPGATMVPAIATPTPTPTAVSTMAPLVSDATRTDAATTALSATARTGLEGLYRLGGLTDGDTPQTSVSAGGVDGSAESAAAGTAAAAATGEDRRQEDGGRGGKRPLEEGRGEVDTQKELEVEAAVLSAAAAAASRKRRMVTGE